MKYCTHCGAELPDDTNVCPNCGCETNNEKTKYCTHCGATIDENATVCPKCGCAVGNNQNDSDKKTLILLIKIFMVLGCISCGSALIPLAWCIPMTLAVWNRLERGEPIGLALKVCSLIFVSPIAGILMLCLKDGSTQDI